MIGIADAGYLQQMRAADCAGGDNHFARCGDVNMVWPPRCTMDTGAALAVERQSLRQRHWLRRAGSGGSSPGQETRCAVEARNRFLRLFCE